MDRMLEMQAFVAVADAQSFSAAAKKLGLSPPSITRTVAALELRLGARLLTRTTRSVRLTDAGRQFQDDAKRILAELEQAAHTAVSAQSRARGHLRLTAPVLFGEMHLMPVLRDFFEVHPEVTASVMLLDRVVNIIEEGLDIALRIGHFGDGGLHAVTLGTVRRCVVAAPAYLQRYGTPQHPSELAHHRIAMSVGATASRDWVFGDAANACHVRVTPQLASSTLRSTIGAAREGWALTRVLSYQVLEDLRRGDLVTVLQGFEPPPLPVCLVFPLSRRPSARLMAFVEMASERLTAVLQA